jgi:phage-related protein
MAQPPILVLTPAWSLQEKHKTENYATPLGDGYAQRAIGGMSSALVEWEVSRTGLTEAQVNALFAELELYTGVTGFQWRPDPTIGYQVYTCERWNKTPMGGMYGKLAPRLPKTFQASVLPLLTNSTQLR